MMDDYTRGYNAGYRAGLRHREGKAIPPQIVDTAKPYRRSDVHDPEMTYRYMVRECPSRGGFMFEGLRPRYESGECKDEVISYLLHRGWIKPHPDPQKGWVPVIPPPPLKTPRTAAPE
jgi:hypothetical protein